MPKFRHLSYMLIRVYNGSHLINDILHYFALGDTYFSVGLYY